MSVQLSQLPSPSQLDESGFRKLFCLQETMSMLHAHIDKELGLYNLRLEEEAKRGTKFKTWEGYRDEEMKLRQEEERMKTATGRVQ